MGESPGDLLQGQTVFADFDEVVQPPGVVAVQPVLKPDQEAVQPPGQVFAGRRIQGTMRIGPCGRLVAVQVMPQAAQERLVAAVAVKQLIGGQLARVGEACPCQAA